MKASPGAHTQQLILLCSLYQIGQLGSVRWGNPHLDFEIRISDFATEHEIRPHGGFPLRYPNPDFMDFFFTVQSGSPKRICKIILVNSGLLFANYACKTAVFKNSLSILFRIPQKKERKGIQE